jgi:hypothetical protein
MSFKILIFKAISTFYIKVKVSSKDQVAPDSRNSDCSAPICLYLSFTLFAVLWRDSNYSFKILAIIFQEDPICFTREIKASSSAEVHLPE